MTETAERKNKYIGFRIAFNDYLRIAELCNKNNLTITDFILSAVYPAIEKIYLTPVKQSVKQDVKQENNNVPTIHSKTEKKPNATIEALRAKEKTINLKLQQLKSI